MALKRFYSFLLLSLLTLDLYSQEYTTVTYLSDDSAQLKMDIFKPVSGKVNNPAFIYVHGGGFSSGQRSDGHLICKIMSEHGYVAATISYTLYMKGKSFSCDGITSEKIKAIRYAANDLWLATNYLLEHAKELKIDTSGIFIAGCSAGAETVLHAQFWNYQLMNWNNKKHPSNFRYAGVISGAGALMDLNLITGDNLVPLMLFHGDKDDLVPYGTAAHHFCDPAATGWLMFFGSHSIFNYVKDLNGSVMLFTFNESGHEVANFYFERDMNQILDFCNKVLKREHFLLKSEIKI